MKTSFFTAALTAMLAFATGTMNASQTSGTAKAPPRSVPKSVSAMITIQDRPPLRGNILWQPSRKTYKFTQISQGGMSAMSTRDIGTNIILELKTQRPVQLDAARRDYNNRKYDAVITALTPLLDEYIMLEQDAEIAAYLAQAHLAQNNPAEAVKVCERVAAGKPETAYRNNLAFVYWDALRAQGNADKADLLLEKCLNSGAVLPPKYWDDLKARNKIALLKALILNSLKFKPADTIDTTYWEPFKTLGDTDLICQLINAHVSSCEKIPLSFFNLFVDNGQISQLDQLIEAIIKSRLKRGGIPAEYWNDPLATTWRVMEFDETSLASRFIIKSLELGGEVPDSYKKLAMRLQNTIVNQRREKYNKEAKEIKEKYNAKCKIYVDQLVKEIEPLKGLYLNANLPAGVEAVKNVERNIKSIYGDTSSERIYRGYIDSYNRRLSSYSYYGVNTDELRAAIERYNNKVRSFIAEESKERANITEPYLAFLNNKYKEFEKSGMNDEATYISYDRRQVESILENLNRNR